MKLLLLLFLPLVSLAQYWDDTPGVKALKSHVDEITLLQNEGRAPGSEGEKAVALYLYDALAARGVDMISPKSGEEFGVLSSVGDTLVSRNVIGLIEGYDPALKNHYVVIGARMDNLGTNTLTIDGKEVTQVYTGANGNASGVATLIELAGRLSSNSIMLRRSVIIVGFGSSTRAFAGAWHFLHHTFAKDLKNIDVMVNLDILGCSKYGMIAFASGNEDLADVVSSLSSTPFPIKPQMASSEAYPSDHQVFYDAQIPSIVFSSGRYPEHNTPRDVPSIIDYDFMEREQEYLYNFVLRLADLPDGKPSFRYVPKQSEDDGRRVAWADCDVPPTFLSNANPSFFMQKWVYQYLKYPQECIENGIQGRVMVEFTIGKDGKVKDVHVIKSVDPLLDAAAVKVVAASPNWKSARKDGKKVDCYMTIPVEFKLKKRK